MGHANAGQFVWFDLLTKDPKAAMAFYGEVVGWKTQPFGDGGDYTMWVGSQGPLGGVMKLPEEAAKMGAPPHWSANVQVDDVDATVALVKELGGKIYKAPENIPTVGRFAVIGDLYGASISVFQPSGDMKLHDNTKPGEFCWCELYTTDQNAAFTFYSRVFGWKKMTEMEMGPMGTYVIFGLGEKQLGGMMKKPAENPMPPMWGYYTEVDDLDAAIARATKQGAKVLNGPMDVPGGRVAQLMDPQGAAFALHRAAAK
ncbi:MAG TPA: VOC family protein [Polyangiaceae bacterium]|nr:VOC family protein [Polyangiaceae bacterium]